MPNASNPVTAGRVGYARVSTVDQNLDLQEKALKREGCLKIFTDRASGKREDRPGLAELMHFLRAGDTLVVWKLDRLGRDLKHLIELVNELAERGVKFRSLTENIDTETAAGRMFFQMVGMFAEFEREQNRERTMAGLAAARARGRLGGRKPKLDAEKIKQARALLKTDPPTKHVDVARILNCSLRTLRRGLAEFPDVESQPAISVDESHTKKKRVTTSQSPRAATGA
jgi:DNA invertase Pin-like site-specific DNA recombinase